MTHLAIRPQPLGIFPLPAGYLVLPEAPGAAEYALALCAGRVPAAPPALRFYGLALAGDTAAALAALADDSSPEARYNRLVLGGDPVEYPQLRSELSGELALLLDLLAYALGWSDLPPTPGAATGELAACVLSAQAAFDLERGQDGPALATLGRALEAAEAVSPLLAAQIRGDLAEIAAARGDGREAVQHYREALALAAGSEHNELRAQLAMRLAMVYQNLAQGRREWLLEAAKGYQEALKVYSRERYPELFALAQNNLALAYLAMPLSEAGDQLRMGIAVQSLREALKIYTRATHPERWSSAQLNLANALQYLPSKNPADHLAEAVELYEELLAARDPAADPLGYGRVLANQGNALAHLGIFVHARPKLEEAVRIFAAAGEDEAAASVRAALDEIAQLEAERQEAQPDGAVPAPAV